MLMCSGDGGIVEVDVVRGREWVVELLRINIAFCCSYILYDLIIENWVL